MHSRIDKNAENDKINLEIVSVNSKTLLLLLLLLSILLIGRDSK